MEVILKYLKKEHVKKINNLNYSVRECLFTDGTFGQKEMFNMVSEVFSDYLKKDDKK